MTRPFIDFVIAAAVGAAIASVVGYIVYAIPGSDESMSFPNWVTHFPLTLAGWAIAGGAAGAAVLHLASKRA